MATPVRVCPMLVILSPDVAPYNSASNAESSLFLEVRPLVEPLSLNEAYLDVTENTCGEVYGTVAATAQGLLSYFHWRCGWRLTVCLP